MYPSATSTDTGRRMRRELLPNRRYPAHSGCACGSHPGLGPTAGQQHPGWACEGPPWSAMPGLWCEGSPARQVTAGSRVTCAAVPAAVPRSGAAIRHQLAPAASAQGRLQQHPAQAAVLGWTLLPVARAVLHTRACAHRRAKAGMGRRACRHTECAHAVTGRHRHA